MARLILKLCCTSGQCLQVASWTCGEAEAPPLGASAEYTHNGTIRQRVNRYCHGPFRCQGSYCTGTNCPSNKQQNTGSRVASMLLFILQLSILQYDTVITTITELHYTTIISWFNSKILAAGLLFSRSLVIYSFFTVILCCIVWF